MSTKSIATPSQGYCVPLGPKPRSTRSSRWKSTSAVPWRFEVIREPLSDVEIQAAQQAGTSATGTWGGTVPFMFGTMLTKRARRTCFHRACANEFYPPRKCGQCFDKSESSTLCFVRCSRTQPCTAAFGLSIGAVLQKNFLPPSTPCIVCRSSEVHTVVLAVPRLGSAIPVSIESYA